MQSEHGLLICGLRCYGPHAGLLRCRSDCTSICCVGLIILDERANEPCMQQDDLMTWRHNLARPPVRTPTGFQGDPTGRALAKEFYKFVNRRFTTSPVSASIQYIWNVRFAISSPNVVGFVMVPPFPSSGRREGGVHTIYLAFPCR